MPGGKKFTRQDSLGDDYSVEAILERISGERVVACKQILLLETAKSSAVKYVSSNSPTQKCRRAAEVNTSVFRTLNRALLYGMISSEKVMGRIQACANG